MGPICAWDFGTRGNDEPGDQAALEAAIVEAGADGRDLYIPGRSRYSLGIYRVTNSLVVPSGMRVFGDGARTILRAFGATHAGVMVDGVTLFAVIGSVASTDVTIESLTIDTTTHGTVTNGIAFIPSQAFEGAPCSDIRVARCRVLGRPSHHYLIWSFSTQRISVVDNLVDGTCTDFATFEDQNGIEIVGGRGAIVRGNQVRRCANFGIGAVALNGYTSGVDGAIIEGNHVDACGVGVSLGTSQGPGAVPQDLRNVLVAGNVIRGSNRYGVDVWTPTAGAKMVNALTSNNVIDGGKVAVYVRGHAGDRGHRNVVVAGNVSTGATTTSVADAAIAVTSFQGAAVRDNSVADCAGAAVRVSFADDVTITGNDVTGSASNGVAGTTAKRLLVEGNRFTGCGVGSTYSVFVSATTDAAIVGNTFTQSGPFAHVQLTGTQGRIKGNTSLEFGGANLGQNLTTEPEGTF